MWLINVRRSRMPERSRTRIVWCVGSPLLCMYRIAETVLLSYSDVQNMSSNLLYQSPHLRTPDPRLNPGFTPLYITNVGVNHGLNPGFAILRCGTWCTCTLSLYINILCTDPYPNLAHTKYMGLNCGALRHSGLQEQVANLLWHNIHTWHSTQHTYACAIITVYEHVAVQWRHAAWRGLQEKVTNILEINTYMINDNYCFISILGLVELFLNNVPLKVNFVYFSYTSTHLFTIIF
jgi:hypothetical protein